MTQTGDNSSAPIWSKVGDKDRDRHTVASDKCRTQLFCDIWSTLKQAGHNICILHGYEEYPERISSDIDAVSGDPETIPRILSERGIATVVQAIEHERSAFRYDLYRRCEGEPVYIALDVSSDFRHSGRIFLDGKMFIEASRPYKFFEVPSAEHEFIYYLIKRLAKGSLGEDQVQMLNRLYSENPMGCNRQLARFFPQEEAELILEAARLKEWGIVQKRVTRLRRAMLRKLGRERPLQSLRYLLGDCQRRVQRILHPTGVMVVFLGTDGSGKSTVIGCVQQRLEPVFRQTARYHLRPRLRKRKGQPLRAGTQSIVTEPHAQPLRGRASSLAKLAFWWMSYTFGYLRDIFPQLTRSTLIVFDRYYHDLLVDAQRYRYRGSLWAARLVGKFVPRPHLFILLDAPPEVLFARKQEVAFHEISRQREAYLMLVQSLDNGHVVDASKPLAEVVLEVEKVVLDYMVARTASRLGIGQNT
jgi:thymidylate kinase